MRLFKLNLKWSHYFNHCTFNNYWIIYSLLIYVIKIASHLQECAGVSINSQAVTMDCPSEDDVSITFSLFDKADFFADKELQTLIGILFSQILVLTDLSLHVTNAWKIFKLRNLKTLVNTLMTNKHLHQGHVLLSHMKRKTPPSYKVTNLQLYVSVVHICIFGHSNDFGMFATILMNMFTLFNCRY